MPLNSGRGPAGSVEVELVLVADISTRRWALITNVPSADELDKKCAPLNPRKFIEACKTIEGVALQFFIKPTFDLLRNLVCWNNPKVSFVVMSALVTAALMESLVLVFLSTLLIYMFGSTADAKSTFDAGSLAPIIYLFPPGAKRALGKAQVALTSLAKCLREIHELCTWKSRVETAVVLSVLVTAVLMESLVLVVLSVLLFALLKKLFRSTADHVDAIITLIVAFALAYRVLERDRALRYVSAAGVISLFVVCTPVPVLAYGVGRWLAYPAPCPGKVCTEALPEPRPVWSAPRQRHRASIVDTTS